MCRYVMPQDAAVANEKPMGGSGHVPVCLHDLDGRCGLQLVYQVGGWLGFA